MLGKLMKYDLKKMMRVLIYIYVISIALAGITRFINIWSDIQAVFIIGQVFAGLTYSAIAAILVNTFVHILLAFSNGFYKDASYLTHTLPVHKNKLLLSKFLSGLLVILASVAVCALSLIIMFFSNEFFEVLRVSIESVVAGFNMSVGLFLTLIVLLIFLEICAIMSMVFTSIVIANKYNSKRVLKGLLWFALFYFGSIISTVLVAVLVFGISGNLAELGASVLSQGAFTTILIIGLVLYAIYAVAFYFICNKLFNKGVNVD